VTDALVNHPQWEQPVERSRAAVPNLCQESPVFVREPESVPILEVRDPVIGQHWIEVKVVQISTEDTARMR
jgi:hypothetical protein